MVCMWYTLSICCLLSFLSGCDRLGDRPSHKDLLNYVVPHAAAKWYDLGLQLMDPRYEDQQAIIKEDGRSDVQECCRKMLNYWLEAEESPTWNKVICGLKAVRLNYVASNIEIQLQGLSLTLRLLKGLARADSSRLASKWSGLKQWKTCRLVASFLKVSF